ncbi:hypothetical protein AALP_AA4G132400 [Arabis alpina]|uniref:Uncharacterized protein n=1 Tax=Arabis alpina TaxID=50452 RepID=A0A087H2Z7_ARAAL|nr:hypothetical protein AALP_AA4G132400 [Arabis alpina]
MSSHLQIRFFLKISGLLDRFVMVVSVRSHPLFCVLWILGCLFSA